jgi:cell division protein FtsW
LRASRLYKNPIYRWWWSLDRTLLGLIVGLMVVGAFVVTTSSGAVASEYGVSAFYFARKQWLFLCLAFCAMLGASTLSPKQIKVIGSLIFIGALAGILLTIFSRVDVKGASRWIQIFSFKIQPTEFMKIGLIIVTAMLLSFSKKQKWRQRFFISLVLIGVIEAAVISQPDFGMFGMLGLIWGMQVFLAGVPIVWVVSLVTLGMSCAVGAYTVLPHVRSRLSRFLDPESGDSYQVDRAMEAFLSGGWRGVGAGEGVVKEHLPDAHTDFVFAVIGEEFGLIACFALLLLYGAITFRGFIQVMDKKEQFAFLAASGILVLFALQVLINIAVVLQLIPTTGMTLPFISYGGSATLTMGIVMGILLALTRKGQGQIKNRG